MSNYTFDLHCILALEFLARNKQASVFHADHIGEHINASHATLRLDYSDFRALCKNFSQDEVDLLRNISEEAALEDNYILYYTTRDALLADYKSLAAYIESAFPGQDDDTYFDYMTDAIYLFDQMTKRLRCFPDFPANIAMQILHFLQNFLKNTDEDDENYAFYKYHADHIAACLGLIL